MVWTLWSARRLEPTRVERPASQRLPLSRLGADATFLRGISRATAFGHARDQRDEERPSDEYAPHVLPARRRIVSRVLRGARPALRFQRPARLRHAYRYRSRSRPARTDVGKGEAGRDRNARHLGPRFHPLDL